MLYFEVCLINKREFLDKWDVQMCLIQALDEKVIIFKKKRRKNYRRTTGHRQVRLKLHL